MCYNNNNNNNLYSCPEMFTIDKYIQRKILSSKSGNLSSVRFKSEQASYYDLNIFFDPPVDINRDIRHRIGASISGSSSYLGQNGQKSVLCSGVTFNFVSSVATGRNNKTNVDQGQFPEFLFTLKILLFNYLNRGLLFLY